MRMFNASVTLSLGCALVWTAGALAQGRGGGGDWTTTGGDGQRSNWVRSDPKISLEHFQKPGFALAWKIKLNGEPSIASTLDRYIGYRGFRSYAFVGSASGELTAIDSDLGRVEWQKKLSASAAARASTGCPAGMTANVTRPTSVMIAGSGRGNAGGAGRGGAKSGVGEPGEGAITLAPPLNPGAAGPANAGRGGRGAQGGGAPFAPATPGTQALIPGAGGAPADPNAGRRGGGGGFGRQGSFLYALSNDGMFHSMYVSNGDEPKPPVQFVPASANARDLTMVDSVVYAATAGGCAGAPNGIWALDTTSSQLSKWTTTADVAGSGFAFGPDATVYAATTSGDLVSLEPKTLQVKSVYRASGQSFGSAPVVFQYNTKLMVIAATQDGHLHLVDGASLTGAAYPGVITGGLASWEDASGTRWILGPSKDAVASWKVVEQEGALALQSGWKSAEMASPLAPIIVNGVVFTVSNSPSAVLHALDGTTGKELWNSGKTMTSAVRTSGLSGAGSQIYIGTSDGMIYAFGFPIEH
jgi:hypothetical protein